MITNAKKYFYRILDYVDNKNPLLFMFYLYSFRWIAAYSTYFIFAPLFTNEQLNAASVDSLIDVSIPFMFLYLGIFYPLVETFFECLLIFWILQHIFNYKPKNKNRPWIFILTSAIVMALLHQRIAAMPPTFATGIIFAYCFGHFSEKNLQRSYWYTAILHSLSNATGILYISIKNAYF